jgi:glycosyltransferase involved in cell wall biosynthesis
MPQIASDFAWRRAHHLIAHNISMKNIIVERLKIPERRISVIPHIELGDPSASPRVKEAGHEVLFFGRIWQYKGLEYLIRAQPLLTERVPEAKIVIAGHGESFARYRAAMVDPERFEVHNEFIPDEKIARLFRRASLIVLPYIEATQSGVVPLAYNFAKPVVATTVGGLPSQVDDGRTGYLVPPRDSQALADKIALLLQDTQLRHRLGANGRAKLTNEWSADVVSRQTVAAYRKALAEAMPDTKRQASL